MVVSEFITSDLAYTKKLARCVVNKDVTYMDAGMTGGDAKVFKRTQGLLASVAKKLIYLSPSGYCDQSLETASFCCSAERSARRWPVDSTGCHSDAEYSTKPR